MPKSILFCATSMAATWQITTGANLRGSEGVLDHPNIINGIPQLEENFFLPEITINNGKIHFQFEKDDEDEYSYLQSGRGKGTTVTDAVKHMGTIETSATGRAVTQPSGEGKRSPSFVIHSRYPPYGTPAPVHTTPLAKPSALHLRHWQPTFRPFKYSKAFDGFWRFIKVEIFPDATEDEAEDLFKFVLNDPELFGSFIETLESFDEIDIITKNTRGYDLAYSSVLGPARAWVNAGRPKPDFWPGENPPHFEGFQKINAMFHDDILIPNEKEEIIFKFIWATVTDPDKMTTLMDSLRSFERPTVPINKETKQQFEKVKNILVKGRQAWYDAGRPKRSLR